jgi:hypothetical protein
MTNADRLQRWNHWYEQTPELWRFQIIVWTLLLVGAVNMLLTIAVGFPFALLVGIAIAAIAAVRVPYVLGWVRNGDHAGPRLEIGAPSWVLQVNRWYDGLDEQQRPLVLLAALAIPGAINMWLTFAGGFPFGLLFLLAVLAVVAIRAPYTAGWFKESPGTAAAAAVPSPARAATPPAASTAPRLGGGSGEAPPASTATSDGEPAAGREGRRPAKPRSAGNDAQLPPSPPS